MIRRRPRPLVFFLLLMYYQYVALWVNPRKILKFYLLGRFQKFLQIINPEDFRIILICDLPGFQKKVFSSKFALATVYLSLLSFFLQVHQRTVTYIPFAALFTVVHLLLLGATGTNNAYVNVDSTSYGCVALHSSVQYAYVAPSRGYVRCYVHSLIKEILSVHDLFYSCEP